MNRVSIGSDNGLLPIWRQAIIWTNAALLSIGPSWTTFNEIWNKIRNLSLKMHLKMSSVKWRPFCSGGDELTANVIHAANTVLYERASVKVESLVHPWTWYDYCFKYLITFMQISQRLVSITWQFHQAMGLLMDSVTSLWHIAGNPLITCEIRTKWRTFARQHFQMQFVE